MKLTGTGKHYYLICRMTDRIFSFLLTFFCFEEKKKVYAFFCYFSCASKKSKEYKQKDKSKFIILSSIFEQKNLIYKNSHIKRCESHF